MASVYHLLFSSFLVIAGIEPEVLHPARRNRRPSAPSDCFHLHESAETPGIFHGDHNEREASLRHQLRIGLRIELNDGI